MRRPLPYWNINLTMSNSKINAAIASVSKRLKFKLYDKQAEKPETGLAVRFCSRRFRTKTLGGHVLPKRRNELPPIASLRGPSGTNAHPGSPSTTTFASSTDVRRLSRANTLAIRNPGVLEPSSASAVSKLHGQVRLSIEVSPLDKVTQDLNLLQVSNKHLLQRCTSDLGTVKTSINGLRRTLGAP